jgi:hypothetical protein
VGAHRGRGELIAFATFVTGHWTLSAKHVNAALSDPRVLHDDYAASRARARSIFLLCTTPPTCRGTVSVMSMSGWNVSVGLQRSPPRAVTA